MTHIIRAKPKSGKYGHIIDKLPRMFTLDAPYQDRVTATIAQVVETAKQLGETLTPARLAQMYSEIREMKEEAESELHEINLRLEAAAQMLANEFDAQGISTIKLDNGASVQTSTLPHSVVVDKEAFRLWCIQHGYERDMVLPWMKTNAIVKERLLEGEKEPDGVEAIARPQIIYRGA